MRIPFTGEDGTSDEWKFVPGLFGVFSLNSCWKLGLGVNAPFGYTTDWGETWIGRYYGTLSELTTLNLNPSVAVRLHRNWSVAVGVDILYAKAELAQSIDFGALLGAPQLHDGQVTIEGDSWGVGFNAGLLWEPTPCTRVGIHYRSQVEEDLDGTADFRVPAAAAALPVQTGRFRDGPVEASVTFPQSVGLSVYQQLGRMWAILGDVTWTGWSTFDELRIRYQNPAEPDSVTPWDWDDTWRVALGVNFQPSWRWTFRVGAAWDQEPVPDETRTPRIPGNDRLWLACGVGFRLSPCWSVDLSYAHIFVDDGPIDLSSPAGGHLVGQVESSVEVFGVQLNLDF